MIHTSRTVTVGKTESIINEPIVLYRGDREVEVEFAIVGSKFTFTNGGNVIQSTNATHGQLVVDTPTGENMFSEVTECHEGKVIFTITKEMIDELAEVGLYSFQIRLFDESQVSRVTIPPVYQGIEIRHPMAAEDETDLVDIGLVDYSVVRKNDYENVETFLPNGDYNKTNWEEHDVISKDRLNKVEDALYEINKSTEGLYPTFQNQYDEFSAKVNKDVKVYKEEMEDEVEQFERDMTQAFGEFKVDYKDEVHDRLDVVEGELSHFKYYLELSNLEYNSDIYEKLTECLEECRIKGGGTIIVPRGRFYLSKQLSIFDNTKLILQKDTIIIAKDTCNSMLLNGKDSGCSNISVDGGVWMANEHATDSHIMNIFAIGRGTGIKIKNCIFKNVVNHHCIDIVGSENIIIENCSFEGYKNDVSIEDRYYAEAIQIGEHTQEGFSYFGPYDNKGVSNITIKNCIFKASDIFGSWAVGIGSHTAVVDVYNNGIFITNNIFECCTYCGISFFKWNDVTIDNNRFNKCDVGIRLINPILDSFGNDSYQSGKKLYINNNSFISNNTGITGYGAYKDSNNYDWFSHITISNNKFLDDKVDTIKLTFTDNLRFTDNTICNGNIQFNIPRNLTVKDNYIENVKNNGLYIENASDTMVGMSENILIENNVISKCPSNGIRLTSLAGVKIFSNRFKECAIGGYASYIFAKNVNMCDIRNNTSTGNLSTYISNGVYCGDNCQNFKLTDNDFKCNADKYYITDEIIAKNDCVRKLEKNNIYLLDGITNVDTNNPLCYIKTSDKSIVLFGVVTHTKVSKGEFCNLQLAKLPTGVFPAMTQEFITPAGGGGNGIIPINRIRVRGEDGIIELVISTSDSANPYTVLNGITILLR